MSLWIWLFRNPVWRYCVAVCPGIGSSFVMQCTSFMMVPKKDIVYQKYWSWHLLIVQSETIQENKKKPDEKGGYHTAWKVPVFGVFLIFIFPHLDWIRTFTKFPKVSTKTNDNAKFSGNKEKTYTPRGLNT